MQAKESQTAEQTAREFSERVSDDLCARGMIADEVAYTAVCQVVLPHAVAAIQSTVGRVSPEKVLRLWVRVQRYIDLERLQSAIEPDGNDHRATPREWFTKMVSSLFATEVSPISAVDPEKQAREIVYTTFQPQRGGISFDVVGAARLVDRIASAIRAAPDYQAGETPAILRRIDYYVNSDLRYRAVRSVLSDLKDDILKRRHLAGDQSPVVDTDAHRQ